MRVRFTSRSRYDWFAPDHEPPAILRYVLVNPPGRVLLDPAVALISVMPAFD